MDIAEIRQLMQDFSNLSIGKLSLECDDFKISLEKLLPGQMLDCRTSVDESLSAKTGGIEDETVKKPGEVAVCSPVVGVFYATPSPGAEPYVKVGQRVEKGQTLCIVEAMKMMNEIPAPVSGTVTRILAVPESAVEFEQPLMFILQD